jgi:hypothetical protein
MRKPNSKMVFFISNQNFVNLTFAQNFSQNKIEFYERVKQKSDLSTEVQYGPWVADKFWARFGVKFFVVIMAGNYLEDKIMVKN